jgi:hypothetical protein
MNATKRIATLTLGLGLMAMSATAFAHGEQPNKPQGFFTPYDHNGDLYVSFAEFQQTNLAACQREFAELDYNRDNILTSYERNTARRLECEALIETRDYVRVPSVRPSWYPYSNVGYRNVRERGFHRQDGLTLYELRRNVLERSRAEFASADCDHDGWLTKHELVTFKTNDELASRRAPRPVRRYGRNA